MIMDRKIEILLSRKYLKKNPNLSILNLIPGLYLKFQNFSAKNKNFSFDFLEEYSVSILRQPLLTE